MSCGKVMQASYPHEREPFSTWVRAITLHVGEVMDATEPSAGESMSAKPEEVRCRTALLVSGLIRDSQREGKFMRGSGER